MSTLLESISIDSEKESRLLVWEAVPIACWGPRWRLLCCPLPMLPSSGGCEPCLCRMATAACMCGVACVRIQAAVLTLMLCCISSLIAYSQHSQEHIAGMAE